MRASLLNKLFQHVLSISATHGIDESHGMMHAMNTLHFARELFNSERTYRPNLREHEDVIYTSAIMHDMCDKKYMDEETGFEQFKPLLISELAPDDVDAIEKIVKTMSYSKVKENGFPYMGAYQSAYHIVREADLLGAYDFDRSMIYHLHNTTPDIEQAFQNACEIFDNRVLKHNDDELFVTESGRRMSLQLHQLSLIRRASWQELLSGKRRKL
jgi:hypothetical protein